MPDESNQAGPAAHAPTPVLEYQRSIGMEKRALPPRRTIPPPFGIGFSCAAGFLTIAWLTLEATSTGRFVSHLALYVAFGVFASGVGYALSKRRRLVGAGILTAVGVWLLLLSACATMGLMRPWVL